MDANGESRRRRLSSWKEIADYLGWDERTCLRWEKKLGLPVHRIDPESKRSRVFAYQDDLDRWLAGRGNRLPPEERSAAAQADADRDGARPALRRVKGALPLLLLLAFAAAVLGLIYFAIFKPAGDPADFTIRGSSLVIRDENGRDLWSYDTGFKKLAGEAWYRDHFQNESMDQQNFRMKFPMLVIRDVDADGRNEVVFTARTDDPVDMGPVVCFDRHGKILWKFEPGREMTFGDKLYSNDYWVEIMDVVDLDDDGLLETVVVSAQIPFFPTQIAVLDSGGNLRGEYWNSGRLSSCVAKDLDGDGIKELLFGGKNNEYRKPCLVVFDSGDVRGGSPQSMDHYASPALEPGSERHYLLLPNTEVDLIEEAGGASLSTIQVLANERLALWTAASLACFEISPDVIITDVRLSDTFRRKYTRYQAEGRIAAGVLDEDACARALAGEILYHDGLGWRPEPFLKTARLERLTGLPSVPR